MPRVCVESLEKFAEELLLTFGTPQDIADIVTESLINADLRGHSSHGVRQIGSKYAREIEAGKIEPTNYPVVTDEGNAWAQINGNRTFGHAAGKMGVEKGLQKAREHAIGIVGLNNVTHIGRVGEFAERACDSGMAFIAFVSNPGSAWVTIPGSTQRRLSTNPITIGIPTFDGLEFPLIADLSTSQVAHGKIKERAASDEPLPNGWVVGDSGEFLTDAAAFEYDDEGAILPLGGHVSGYKGFGLGLLTELLAAHLSDGSVSGMDDVIFGNHVVFIAVDLPMFTSPAQIASRAEILSEYVRSTKFSKDIDLGPAAIGNQTLLPGEAEFQAIDRTRDEGVPFSAEDARTLVELASCSGVETTAIPEPLLNA